MKVAFYAPMKPPDHPVPSGDRLMARQLIEAIEAAGHEINLSSKLRSHAREPDASALARLTTEAAEECARLLDGYRTGGTRPDLWFTYHLYYKAPDLIGPAISRALGIPYVVAEASYARKRDATAWRPWQVHVIDAVRHADAILCFTEPDREGLLALGVEPSTLIPFPPFLAHRPTARSDHQRDPNSEPHLVAVAMMRSSNKLDSYRDLALALQAIAALPWRLTIVGDGPERRTVEAYFAPVAGRVAFAGECRSEQVAAHLTAADLLVWPGVREAYGLAYLEAAAYGVPAVAYADGGVPAVVTHGRTGLLVRAGDVGALAAAVARLIGDGGLRHTLGAAARMAIATERNLEAASRRLDAVLRRSVGAMVP